MASNSENSEAATTNIITDMEEVILTTTVNTNSSTNGTSTPDGEFVKVVVATNVSDDTAKADDKATSEKDKDKDSEVPPPDSNAGSLKPFKIERDTKEDVVYVRIIDVGLVNTIQKFIHRDDLYGPDPKISAHELFMVLPELQKSLNRDPEERQNKKKKDESQESKDQKSDPDNTFPNPNYDEILEQLVDWLEEEFDAALQQIKNMIDEQVISFKYLWRLFTKDTEIYAEWDDKICGARVTKCDYNKSFFGNQYMIITGKIIDSDGYSFNHGIKTWVIGHFAGVSKIESLPVVPLPKESPIRDELVERGRKFARLALGPHYLHYTGRLFRQTWFGPTYFKGDGRVMIDPSSFAQTNPNYEMGTAAKVNRNTAYSQWNGAWISGGQQFASEKEIREDEFFMCAPTLFGFSFAAKKWGQFYVDQLNDIVFDDDAFDHLVMDPVKKDIVMSLVKSERTKGVDLISGKGGGCIFLLHGPPGVGKTLTAEAISEYLHRPLYAVGVGELGTTTSELEDKLSEILQVASVWNAVILIDEADIFLERRSEHDIHRNALVGIFLRLLEYHQGILFLTTNRVKCFDKAFHSRISVALKYSELDETARAQVWRTFLDRVDGKDKSQADIDKLKLRQINGREIKTAVRLAKALATKTDPDACITTSHLTTILDISQSFTEEILDVED